MVLPTSLAALRRLASLWVRRAEFTIDEVAFNLFVGLDDRSRVSLI